MACLIEHYVELVIASAGAPGPIVGPLHDAGCQVFADVASLRQVDRAVESGVDGLVLLTAGAGGQTGWAIRSRSAARVLGADLGYLGTKFIATGESLVTGEQTGDGFGHKRLLDPRDGWSAGHSVSGVTDIASAATLVDRTHLEYEQARKRTLAHYSGLTAPIARSSKAEN